MLRYLRVSQLAVVEEVVLELREGLTSLTGETGAGKSILVDALTLLLGARASADMIRTGAREATIEGIFLVESNTAALAQLDELGVTIEDGELILRREIQAGGRGRAFVNGSLQPMATLRRLGETLADVHGQLEHVRLLDPATHLDLLDHFAGLGRSRSELARLYERSRTLETKVRQLTEQASERQRRIDFLRFELREIDDAELQKGEDEELPQERRVLQHRARVLEIAESGYQTLYESDGAVLEQLRTLHRDLEELSEIDVSVAGLPAQVEAARAAIEDVALTLRDYARDRPLDPERLEEVEARLALLKRLTTKYGPTLADVADVAERARVELESLEMSDEQRAELEREQREADAAFMKLAREVSAGRRSAAEDLERRVEAELEELAMEKTRVRVRIETSTDAGEEAFRSLTGIDRVELDVSTNVGEEPRPLAKVASGGELSRMLLALRTVVADHEPGRVAVFHGLEAGLGGRVSVFDEVDTGIGGNVAHVLARKLRKLATGRQVLCITHLAPVAAAAHQQVRVQKHEKGGRTTVEVTLLNKKERLAELGRMIGGDAVTPAVKRHADELLKMHGSTS